ncbi:YbdD/YjiX family protein [Arthrobacter sp. STN4]|uniref:YbdD/YjiX family protein n=1 Tax=Arthrobacter sp. STN4 TaxID=2923276 RepID=UPI00211A91AF|nr:YbdD/YjiX family protein [Arthrobacter sp. STN4]
MELLHRAAGVLGSVSMYLKGVLGEDAYEKYLDHHRGTGCTTPAKTVKEFWRDRMDRQEGNPEGRCC